MSRSTLLLLLTAPAALLLACGSSTTSGTTATGAGGSTSDTTSATTADTTTGVGGSASASSGAGGGDSTTSTGGTTGATGSTGTGAMMGACTNAADTMILMSKDIGKITGDCASSKLGMEPGTKDCIKMGTGLSDPCVTCFDDTVGCVFKNCLGECIGGSGSQACTDCRAAKCDPAFVACSGLAAN
jgi:hypothetical protein